MIRLHFLAIGAAPLALGGAILTAHAVPTAGEAAAPAAAPAPGADDARYVEASKLSPPQLMNARVLSADERGQGRVQEITFDAEGNPEWAWLRFEDTFSAWRLRAPVSSLYKDRYDGVLRTGRTLEELRRLASADPEISPATATAIPVRYAPASRLMGLEIVGESDRPMGYVHSVEADKHGAADEVVVERRFGLFHAKTERYTVPAEQVRYLPVTEKLVLRSMPQPTLASLENAAG